MRICKFTINKAEIFRTKPNVNHFVHPRPGPFVVNRMETEEVTANPWITVSKRKRSRLSGAQYDAAKDETSKSEQAVERLPTNGFLNLSLHEPGADEEGNGQASDGTANENTTRPSSSEGAVPPRKKTKKDAKKVSLPTKYQNSM
jgi:hypothetical protein